MSLSCGGRGPCCHVGYSHRHCEHCDTVIALSVQPHSHGWVSYPWYQYQTHGFSTLQSQLSSSPLANQFQQLVSGQVTEAASE